MRVERRDGSLFVSKVFGGEVELVWEFRWTWDCRWTPVSCTKSVLEYGNFSPELVLTGPCVKWPAAYLPSQDVYKALHTSRP